MSYEFYKVLHVVGIMLVFLALGGATLHAANGGTREQNASRKVVAALHGTGMLLLIVAGFGMLARIGMGNGIPHFVYPKLLVWLILGAAPAILSRKPGSAALMWFIFPLLGAVAAYFGINHK